MLFLFRNMYILENRKKKSINEQNFSTMCDEYRVTLNI